MKNLDSALSGSNTDAAELLEYRKRELYELMSDISEDCYCAGWMHGNEFRLWQAITDPKDDRRYGQSDIEEWQVNRLRELSEQTGGWWVWEEDNRAFISLDEWRRRLAAIEARNTESGQDKRSR